MRGSGPPALATWLLERIVPGENNEALAGDLLEEFNRRGSAAWYWRQVLGAILAGVSKQLHAGWFEAGCEILWTFGFATVWTCVVPTYQDFMLRCAWVQPSAYSGLIFHCSLFRSFDVRIVGHSASELELYQWAIEIAAYAVIVGSGVGVYLILNRSFSLRRFWSGLLVGLFVVVIGDWVRTTLIQEHLLLVSRSVWWFGWAVYEYGFRWLPLCLAAQVSIWATRSHWLQSKHQVEI
jgi:hypothetical protein